MKQRIKDICNITRYGTELTIRTPMTIYNKDRGKGFQEQRDALERLKQDPKLEITEEEEKIPYTGDGIDGVYWYKIVTIKFKEG